MQSLVTFAVAFLLVSESAFGFSDPGGFNDTHQAAPQRHTQPLGSSSESGKASGFRLEDGTPLRMRLQRTISSADAQVNDQVDFDVLEEIKVNDVVVIPKGSVAWGTVTEAQPKRRMARGGRLNVNIDAVRLADGEKAALRAVKEVKGGGHTGAMTGAMVATGLVFFPAAPLFLFMHGKDITIPKGTEITAYISGNVDLDAAKLAAITPAPGASPPASQATPQGRGDVTAAGSSTLAVKSTPDGADITVDGAFVGNTPSTIKVPDGDHTLSVQRLGFKVWQRTMKVTSGGNVTIDAALEKLP